MQSILQENQHLSDEVRNAQENLRLSANQISKLNSEINEYRSRMDANVHESETYKRKIHSLTSENTNLGEEIKIAQENLRLSAGQMSKLNTEFKIMCNENEELKQRLTEAGDLGRRLAEYENTIAILSQEIERLNSVLENKNNEIGELRSQLQEMDAMNDAINSLQEKIKRLANENTGMGEEVRAAQENLRLSANQNAKLQQQLQSYQEMVNNNNEENEVLKKKVQKLFQENSGLAD